MGRRAVFCSACDQGLTVKEQFGMEKHQCRRCRRCGEVSGIVCFRCFKVENGSVVERQD